MNALMLIWMSGVLPFLLAGQQPSGAQAATAAIENGNFRFTYDERGISGLANPHDPFGATLVPSATPGGARGQSRRGDPIPVPELLRGQWGLDQSENARAKICGFPRHQFISGNGSFFYFVRASGAPPFLLVTVRPGTKLEYTGGGGGRGGAQVYVHSSRTGGAETRGT
jgi:hypothetical protein